MPLKAVLVPPGSTTCGTVLGVQFRVPAYIYLQIYWLLDKLLFPIITHPPLGNNSVSCFIFFLVLLSYLKNYFYQFLMNGKWCFLSVCTFLIICGIDYLYRCLLTFGSPPQWESFALLAPSELPVFSLQICRSEICILDGNSLSLPALKISFSSSLWPAFFIFSVVSFDGQKCYIFMQSSVLISFLCDLWGVFVCC